MCERLLVHTWPVYVSVQGAAYEQTDAVPSFKKHHLGAEIKTLCAASRSYAFVYFHSAQMYNWHMNFETGCVYVCECMRDAGAEIDLMEVFVCVFTFA